MQEELEQIIDCLDTSIPETIRILSVPDFPGACWISALLGELPLRRACLRPLAGRIPAGGLAPLCPSPRDNLS